MTRTNSAAVVPSKQSPTMHVTSVPYSSPGEDELTIRTRAVAINPADHFIQERGLLLTTYPAILGCDVAGEVVEVHPSLTSKFSVGDRVIGASTPLLLKDGAYAYSGFQEYVVLKMPAIAHVPARLDYNDAVVLPLGVYTAASCIFAPDILGLAMPAAGRDAGKNKTLLVWGASSSVGSCGVQLAALAGYDVVAVASAKNHDMVKSLRAKVTFDHNNPAVVDDIVEFLKGKDVVGAYDAISKDSTLDKVCEILDRSDAKMKVVASVRPGAEQSATHGVKVMTNSAAGKASIGLSIWPWLDQALKSGDIKCMPPPEVVGHGLETVQHAVDLMGQGVSAKKLIVTI
ncbi:uncharacterized protein PV06_08690 [Exophiala oligosperma]|uniref:Enoyl reductase (ER) domain-containing protein n=1 Tax=Exophiala oligosperma TaxID=215243 RepID=A0A0D2BMZ9_9EURO|nr:uncharacterized protein PV06_08690 [Exophiala oligosperma]KIW38862.1 hypothetical protein PV06_08690 [Exophiala oligosperma]